MIKKTVGELLKGYRKDKVNISIRDAATEIGIHYTYLSRVESGISEPSEEILNKIANKYRLTSEEKADLFIALKMTPEFKNIIRELGSKKTSEIMYRRSKNKDK